MKMKILNNPELLSPAGDPEKLRIAIAYGADAVYLSGNALGLRAQSTNFSNAELIESVAYAHERGVRCYATMNIYAHPDDFILMGEQLDAYVAAGIDACIVFISVRRPASRMRKHVCSGIGWASGGLCWLEN